VFAGHFFLTGGDVSDYIRQQVKDIDKRVKEIDAALAAHDDLTQERALLLAAREALAGDRAQPRPNVRRSRSRAQPRRRNKRSNQDLIIDYLANNESGTAGAIARATGANRNSLATALNAMTVGGLLEKADRGYRMARTGDQTADAGAASTTQPATEVTQ
jgi:hypothetical protein